MALALIFIRQSTNVHDKSQRVNVSLDAQFLTCPFMWNNKSIIKIERVTFDGNKVRHLKQALVRYCKILCGHIPEIDQVFPENPHGYT